MDQHTIDLFEVYWPTGTVALINMGAKMPLLKIISLGRELPKQLIVL